MAEIAYNAAKATFESHPWSTAGHDGVDEDDHLAGTGDEGKLVWLSGVGETLIDRDEFRVPFERCRQGGGVEAFPQPLTAAFNMAQADVAATVRVIGSNSDEGSGLLAGDAPDLGHTHQDGDGGPQTDAVNADDQLKPVSKIAVLTDGRDELLELLALQPLEAGDLLIPEAPGLLITRCRAARLEARNVLGELLDHGKKLGKGRQAWVRWWVDLLGLSRARSDQGGIDLVVLRQLQPIFGVGPHLRRLEHDDQKAFPAKGGYDRLLVATTRLDADPVDPVLSQPAPQDGVPVVSVVDLQPLRAPIERYVEFAFAGIDAGTDRWYACSSSSTLPCECEPLVPSTSRAR